jgi:hypothetical protein
MRMFVFMLGVHFVELVAWLSVRTGKLDSSRASLSRKILRKHARSDTISTS